MFFIQVRTLYYVNTLSEYKYGKESVNDRVIKLYLCFHCDVMLRVILYSEVIRLSIHPFQIQKEKILFLAKMKLTEF